MAAADGSSHRPAMQERPHVRHLSQELEVDVGRPVHHIRRYYCQHNELRRSPNHGCAAVSEHNLVFANHGREERRGEEKKREERRRKEKRREEKRREEKRREEKRREEKRREEKRREEKRREEKKREWVSAW